MMAEKYGKTPAEILHAEDMAPIERFHFNSDVLQATSQFKEKMREHKRENADPNRVATTQEQQQMVNEQVERKKADAQNPSEQMQNLDAVMERRSTGDDDPPAAPADSGSDGMEDLQHLMGGDQ